MASRKDKIEFYKICHELNSRDVGYELISREFRKAAKNTAKKKAIREQLDDI